jgi:hypothetical protein
VKVSTPGVVCALAGASFLHESNHAEGVVSLICLIASIGFFIAGAIVLRRPPLDPSPIFSRKQDFFILISVLAFSILCFAFVIGHAHLVHK